MTNTQIETTTTTTPAANDKLKWYVVHTYSGFENKAKTALEDRVKQLGLTEQFGEIVIPVEIVEETKTEEKNGKTITKKRQVKRKFAPGYIFVQMELNERTWYLVKDTPKVSGFVGGRHTAPVPESEINQIAQQVAEGTAKPKPRVVFDAGDHVRVTDGAFANFTGSIQEVNGAKQKVTVLVSIFGRATPVELEYAQVEKIAP